MVDIFGTIYYFLTSLRDHISHTYHLLSVDSQQMAKDVYSLRSMNVFKFCRTVKATRERLLLQRARKIVHKLKFFPALKTPTY